MAGRAVVRWRIVLVVAVLLLLAGTYRARGQGVVPPPPATLTIPVATSVTGQPTPPTPGVPALEVHTTQSPAAPAHWSDQVIWALIVSYFLQWMKNCKWFPWLTQDTAKHIQAAWGFGFAALTAAGVHITTTGSFTDVAGAGITITGLSLSAFKDLAFQWASQQGWYDFIVNKRVASNGVEPVQVKVTT